MRVIRGTALDAVFDPRRNSLNALRLVLAVIVIVSHSWPIAGYGPDPKFGDENLGRWAVAGFFTISGYLITGSRLHSSSLAAYLRRRFLRIYPAYFVVLVVVAFGFAAISPLIDPAAEWTPASSIAYVLQNLGLYAVQYSIDGTLTGAPVTDSWNGSLWTLAFEFGCYLLVGLLATLVRQRRAFTAVVALLLVTATIATGLQLLVHPARDQIDLHTLGLHISELAAFFLAGALLHLIAGRVPVSIWLAVASVLAVALLAWSGVFRLLAGIPVAYLMLYLGSRLPLHRVGARNDVSYGMYVYGFPVQQSLALLIGTTAPVPVFVALAITLTVPFAWASWLLVERPAMRTRWLLPRGGTRTDRVSSTPSGRTDASEVERSYR